MNRRRPIQKGSVGHSGTGPRLGCAREAARATRSSVRAEARERDLPGWSRQVLSSPCHSAAPSSGACR